MDIDKIFAAEEGCLQYFTGVSGQIQSYNYDPNTGLQLSNQDYSACIRMERNFCGIQYTVCEDIDEGMASKFKHQCPLGSRILTKLPSNHRRTVTKWIQS